MYPGIDKNQQEVKDKRKEIYRSMSVEEKLSIATELYYAALDLKKAHIRRLNPEWPESKINNKAREWMLYAKS